MKLEKLVNESGFLEQTYVAHRYDNGDDKIELMYRPETSDQFSVKFRSSLMIFAEEDEAKEYILASLDLDKKDAKDDTRFGIAMHKLGYEHDFVLGTDYFKEIPGYTVHIRKEANVTKEGMFSLVVHTPGASSYRTTSVTFTDEDQCDRFIERLMEDYK